MLKNFKNQALSFLLSSILLISLFTPIAKADNITCGDINNDGYVNANDALYLLNYLNCLIVFNQYEKLASDVDQDGKITFIDAEIIMNHSKGFIDSLPVTIKINKYGDINDDGYVNISDFFLILRYLNKDEVFSPSQLHIADVDGDGQVTEKDRDLIEKHMNDEIKRFPVE